MIRTAIASLSIVIPLVAASVARAQDFDPPEVAIGERLFLETRFAQYFFARCAGNVNTNLSEGDPVLDTTETLGGALAGPFAGKSMNCRACHLVDEQAGIRTYNDFARRSPIPDRGDGAAHAPRNAPPLLGVGRFKRGAPVLHADGEFASARDLVIGTFTGRNLGWLPQEHATAVSHMAKVIREDDGTGELAQQFGGSYAAVFAGTNADLPAEFRLRRRFRMNVATASDAQIADQVGRLVAAYLDQLQFAREKRRFQGSPYDLFIARNKLPAGPAHGEAPIDFAARLLRRLEALNSPELVTTNDGAFVSHEQGFRFGNEELAGLKLFLRADANTAAAGNCAACHAPPRFTDLKFHNTGATQEEYDSIHGAGQFAALEIPALAQRNTNYEAWLPATPQHPNTTGRFRDVADLTRPGRTDLGMWNVFANPDMPSPQPFLRRALRERAADNSDAALLERSVARFKTPSLRDLGHSGPYMHNGSKDTVDSVVEFYRRMSDLARAGQLRNGDPELLRIRLEPGDAAALAAFLRSLNEDYE